jgi:hypothetical protein
LEEIAEVFDGVSVVPDTGRIEEDIMLDESTKQDM